MSSAEIQKQLIALGLTTNEAEVYLALLPQNPSPVGPLIASTGLHRNVVYTALEHLRARKWVSESSARGKKMFAITDPQILLTEAETRREAAYTVVQAIKARLERPLQEITVHTGNDEYLELLKSLLSAMPKGKTVYVLGTGGEQFMAATMRPIWKRYHAAAEQQKLSIRMIGYESQRNSFAQDIAPLSYYSVRYLLDTVENPSGVHVYPEIGAVLNIIYSDETKPVTAIKIRDKALTEGYLHLFHNLWKTGRK